MGENHLQCEASPQPERRDILPAHKALPIRLSSEQECELGAQVRAHSTPQELAERARTILLAAIGLGVDHTAAQLGI